MQHAPTRIGSMARAGALVRAENQILQSFEKALFVYPDAHLEMRQ
jgi:hypothetical protein